MERGERYNPLQEARELADNQVEKDFFEGKSAEVINRGARERIDQREAERSAEREHAQERRESIDDEINRVVQFELENFADRRLTPDQAKAEIATNLKELSDRLFTTEDDDERDYLTVQRAVLLRMRQALENDRGIRELPTRVADAEDMPEVSLQQEVQYPRNDQDVVETPGLMGLNPSRPERKIVDGVEVIEIPEGEKIVRATKEEVLAMKARARAGIDARTRSSAPSSMDATGVRPNPVQTPAERTWISEVPQKKAE